MKHTPGPWQVASSMCPYRVIAAVEEPFGVVVVCDTANNAKTRTPENAANANLIAAAPEMYEALKAILDTCLSPDYEGAPSDAAVKLMVAALAKAEGRHA